MHSTRSHKCTGAMDERSRTCQARSRAWGLRERSRTTQAHHFNILEAGADERLQELAADAARADAQHLGRPHLRAARATRHAIDRDLS